MRAAPGFCIGVAGHRPDASARGRPDERAIRAAAAAIITLVQRLVAPGQVHLLSSLAPGPDRWVAAEALAAGAELHVLLPQARDVCARDDIESPGHPGPAEAEFFALTGLAQSITELPTAAPSLAGAAGALEPAAPFVAAGRAIVQRADLLIAVWDGLPARGPGGTGQAVDDALASGVPVIWIPWQEPAAWRVVESRREHADTPS